MALGKNLDPLDSNRADFKSTPSAKGGDFQIYLCTPNRLQKPFSLFEFFCILIIIILIILCHYYIAL